MGVPDTLGDVWTIFLDKPLLMVGGSGDSIGVLGSRSARSPIELSGGRMAIAVDDSERIHVVDGHGQLVHEFGRRGDGPGEIRDAPTLLAHGDSIVTVDERGGTMHVNVFDSAFRFVRGYLVNTHDTRGGQQSAPRPLAVLSSGALVMQYARVPDSTAREHRSLAEGPALGGDAKLVVDNFDGDERIELPHAGMVHNTFLIFGKTGASAVSDGTLYTGSNDGFTVNGFDDAGKLRQRLTIAMKPRPVTRAMRAQFLRDETAGDTTAETRRLSRIFTETAHFATSFRFYDRFLAPRDGGLWIDRARASDDDDHHYWIFDRELQFQGVATLPASRQLLAIWGDTVVVTGEESDGAAWLGLFRRERRKP
jgi:hypothetical protein